LSPLHDLAGAFVERCLHLWLRLFGRKVRKSEAPWLASPTGPRGRIGDRLYEHLAERLGLELRPPSGPVGLIPDFEALRGPGFDPDRVHPLVRHFYERTSLYQLDAWSDAAVITRLCLWFLVFFLSRRMEQLNFPISPLEMSQGMTSTVIPLVDPASGRTAYTGWLRTLAGSGRVIYAGLYAVGRPPGCPDGCINAAFPVPLGTANVFLRPEVDPDGSLRLVSSGKRFGDPGFYRVLEAGDDHWRVGHLRTLREFFHVYVDPAGTLRCDHAVRFLGTTVLRLHYRMAPLPAPVPITGAAASS
jgi:hypothetical protein